MCNIQHKHKHDIEPNRWRDWWRNANFNCFENSIWMIPNRVFTGLFLGSWNIGGDLVSLLKIIWFQFHGRATHEYFYWTIWTKAKPRIYMNLNFKSSRGQKFKLESKTIFPVQISPFFEKKKTQMFTQPVMFALAYNIKTAPKLPIQIFQLYFILFLFICVLISSIFKKQNIPMSRVKSFDTVQTAKVKMVEKLKRTPTNSKMYYAIHHLQLRTRE